mmetsp:Transcript_4631/g.7907  ORF Transcript_4631/g.7907 Transcript_4631/m.7907 type:complete len:105 (+) Transcript_4631:359-673(+)
MERNLCFRYSEAHIYSFLVPLTKTSNKMGNVSKDELAKHNKADDCWISINDHVYNVTDFLNDHPGGKKAILMYAGKDATSEFEMLHKPEVLKKYGEGMKVGPLA